MKRYDYETAPEKTMRIELENRGLKKDVDFIIQKSTRLGFVLDFYFPKKKLNVEVDGVVWHKNKKRDNFRDYLHGKTDIETVRFTDEEIYADIKSCVDKIIFKLSV